MSKSVGSLVNMNVAGQDSYFELSDSNGVRYQVEADSTTGALILVRNGTTVAQFGAGGGGYRIVSAKTGDYTVVAADSGKLFTTSGASGAVNFTLPAVASVSAGWTATFFNAANQNMTITAPSTKLVAFNNTGATSIAFSTSSEKTGAGVTIVFDGSVYLAFVNLGTETQTPTIA